MFAVTFASFILTCRPISIWRLGPYHSTKTRDLTRAEWMGQGFEHFPALFIKHFSPFGLAPLTTQYTQAVPVNIVNPVSGTLAYLSLQVCVGLGFKINYCIKGKNQTFFYPLATFRQSNISFLKLG